MISPVRILTGYTGADFVQWLWSSTVTWRGKQAPGCPLSRGTSSPAHSKSGIICFTNSSQLHDSIASVGEAKSEVPQTAQLIILRWVISPQKEGTWLSSLSATDKNWTLVLNSTPSAVADGALLRWPRPLNGVLQSLWGNVGVTRALITVMLHLKPQAGCQWGGISDTAALQCFWSAHRG